MSNVIPLNPWRFFEKIEDNIVYEGHKHFKSKRNCFDSIAKTTKTNLWVISDGGHAQVCYRSYLERIK